MSYEQEVPEHLVWVDLEGTGLPGDGTDVRITEIGLVVTTLNLWVVESFEALIVTPADHVWSEGARTMADASGLLVELDDATTTIDEADAECARIVHKWTAGQAALPVLRGSSVGGYDRPLVQRWLPELHSCLHPYRTYDVTSTIDLVRRLCGEEAALNARTVHRTDDRTAHRAVDDIYTTILMEDACKTALFEHLQVFV